jgi:hypothetical protein
VAASVRVTDRGGQWDVALSFAGAAGLCRSGGPGGEGTGRALLLDATRKSNWEEVPGRSCRPPMASRLLRARSGLHCGACAVFGPVAAAVRSLDRASHGYAWEGRGDAVDAMAGGGDRAGRSVRVCLWLFRFASWSWMPHTTSDRWAVAAGFARASRETP